MHTFAVEPLYNGHLEGRRKWPLWRGFEQESIYKFLAARTKKSGRCRELVHLTWYFKLSSIAQVRTKARYLCSRWGIDKNKQDWKLLLSSAAEISFRNWTMTFSRNCPLLTVKWWEKGIHCYAKYLICSLALYRQVYLVYSWDSWKGYEMKSCQGFRITQPCVFFASFCRTRLRRQE